MQMKSVKGSLRECNKKRVRDSNLYLKVGNIFLTLSREQENEQINFSASESEKEKNSLSGKAK